MNKFSGCYSLSVNGLVNYFVPNSLKETKIDGIIQFNSWITDGHIETGGDDSISVTLFGEKLYFICAPGTHSKKFEKLIRNVDDFISFVETGPESSAVKSNITFYIPQPDLILCQPSLASHAVLTSTLGVSLYGDGKLVIYAILKELIAHFIIMVLVSNTVVIKVC